jgi:hypothetical protein
MTEPKLRVKGIIDYSELLSWEFERVNLPKSVIDCLEWKRGDSINIDIIKAGMQRQVVISLIDEHELETSDEIEPT